MKAEEADKTYKAFCKKCKSDTLQKRFEVGVEVYDICQTCFALNNLRYEGFHISDGLFFKREEDGNVIIFKLGKNEWHDTVRIFSQRIDGNSWASVVCSVSKQGEDGDRYMKALDFHNSSPM